MRIRSWLLAAALLLSLCACSAPKTPAQEAEKPAVTAEEPAPQNTQTPAEEQETQTPAAEPAAVSSINRRNIRLWERFFVRM